MTATATPEATATETRTRYRWSEQEKRDLIKEYDATSGDERKAVVQKWADKTGAAPQSIVAQVYAAKKAFGQPAGQPRARRASRSTAQPTGVVARVQAMIERKQIEKALAHFA